MKRKMHDKAHPGKMLAKGMHKMPGEHPMKDAEMGEMHGKKVAPKKKE